MTNPASLPDAPAPPPPPDLLRQRRERLMQAVGGGVAVFPAAVELLRSRDTAVPFRQHSDFYYLTGFPEPDAVAVLTGAPEPELTLFVRPRDPEREAWNGARAGVQGALERFGADRAFALDELDERLPELTRDAEQLVYALGAHPTLDERMLDLLVRHRRARPRAGTGPRAVVDPEPALGELRRVKHADEIWRMRAAARIAVEGHRAAMRAASPGVGEWRVQAALEGAFRAAGATGPAFPSIVASGANAAVLHYTENQRRARDGELLLVDAGAEWGMYCSDITRTFPVSGRFSGPQRALYEVVLAAQRAAIDAARPGEPVAGVHRAAVRVLTEGMVELGLLQGPAEDRIEDGAYRRFYLHQTSHWLGLDVHDVGQYREADGPALLQPGMALTVEPGLYFAPDAEGVPEHYRGTGIRIEDDVLVTADGPEVLTAALPTEPDEVERLVGS